jgi:endoglucanase
MSVFSTSLIIRWAFSPAFSLAGVVAVQSAQAGTSLLSHSLAVSPNIRLNQIGFYPQAPKTAAVVNATGEDFYVLSTTLSDTVFSGKLGVENIWDPSNEKTKLANFSSVVTPGQYVLSVPGVGSSPPFTIGFHAHLDLARGSIRAYYYQRSSMTLEKTYAGKWARTAGHPDRRVYIHPSAASANRAAESLISSPGGWYDAGDYGKYVVNSGISTYTLFALYRHYPSLYDTLKLNIPESGNNLPDLLDEALWNFRWMMTMQDPNDGGVYHKLTTAVFSGMVMPELDKNKRYVVQKSVTATLDMAAVAAYASRIFRSFEAQVPGLADSALAASRKAWDWARLNPKAYYNQTEINKTMLPVVLTGEYGDGGASDEFQWAGTELYLATKEDSFYNVAFPAGLPKGTSVPGWPNVGPLAFYSMADEASDEFPLIDTALVKKRIVDAATIARNASTVSPFQVPIGAREFNWGSNSMIGNQGMLMLFGYKLTGDTSFVRGATDVLDYLTGRNGTSYSYVTGYGYLSPLHPHHRPSTADDVTEPVPGLLVGGPNPGQQDKCVYPSSLPALSWSDTDCSYASNEVAINWNAPLAYIAGAMEAIYSAGMPGPQGIRQSGPERKAHRFDSQALLTWEGENPSLVLPVGRRGRVEFFDAHGRRWLAGRSRDSTLARASRPGLLFYLLRLENIGGKEIMRTGAWSTMAPLHIPL